jgi:hypothetical protein
MLMNVVLYQILKKIAGIEEHVQSLENEVKTKHEHIMNCILYRTVCIYETIHAIKINTGYVCFMDVRIVDQNEKSVSIKINRQKRNFGYRHIDRGSKYAEDHTDLLIEFDPVIFKTIEFDTFSVSTKGVYMILLSQNTKTAIHMIHEKNIICNTSMFMY